MNLYQTPLQHTNTTCRLSRLCPLCAGKPWGRIDGIRGSGIYGFRVYGYTGFQGQYVLRVLGDLTLMSVVLLHWLFGCYNIYVVR